MFDFSPIATRRRSRPTNSASKSGEEPQEEPVEVDEKDAVDDGQWSDFTHEPLEVDVVNDKSCIEREGCWEDDIWTGLPYVRIRKEMGIIANGVMMDDQRVMMVAVRPFSSPSRSKAYEYYSDTRYCCSPGYYCTLHVNQCIAATVPSNYGIYMDTSRDCAPTAALIPVRCHRSCLKPITDQEDKDRSLNSSVSYRCSSERDGVYRGWVCTRTSAPA
jgi:hypothetical protein